MKTKTALEAVRSIVSAIIIISPTIETHAFTQALLEKYQVTADKIFDLYLVATMLSHEITSLTTDNERDFIKVHEIKVFNPFLKIILEK
jgi:predicted nucleic acid-binding protein